MSLLKFELTKTKQQMKNKFSGWEPRWEWAAQTKQMSPTILQCPKRYPGLRHQIQQMVRADPSDHRAQGRQTVMSIVACVAESTNCTPHCWHRCPRRQQLNAAFLFEPPTRPSPHNQTLLDKSCDHTCQCASELHRLHKLGPMFFAFFLAIPSSWIKNWM